MTEAEMNVTVVPILGGTFTTQDTKVGPTV